MDDQNWMEKVGLLKEIGDIKGNQIRMGEQMKALIETKSEHHDQVMQIINKHEADLYGPPQPGIKIELDRLLQWKAGILALWGVVLPIAFKVVYDWVRH